MSHLYPMKSVTGTRLLLLVVVLGYVSLCLMVTELDQYFAYDEAIYLSQVYPGPRLPFTAPRARGLPIILAPLGWFNAPVPAIRGYLLLINSALMYVGFNSWIPVLRGRVIVAAAIFAVGWLPLFYATQVFPNSPVAFGTVAAAGYLARYLCRSDIVVSRVKESRSRGVSVSSETVASETGRRRALIACAVAVALIATIRPTEATFVAGGLAAASLTRHGRELALRWTVLAVGLVIGWLPWLVEAQLRFGGPLARLHAASANVGGGFHPENIWYHIGYTDGPLGGTIHDKIPVLGVTWWLLMIIAAVVLIFRAGGRDPGWTRPLGKHTHSGDAADPKRQAQRAGAVAGIVGIACASQYLFLTAVLEARFMLPSYALLTVATVAAAPSWNSLAKWHRSRLLTTPLRLAAFVGVLIIVSEFASWQVGVVRQVEDQQYQSRQVAVRLIQVLRKEVDVRQRDPGQPCYVASDVAFPVFAFGAGCKGGIFHPRSPSVWLPNYAHSGYGSRGAAHAVRTKAPDVFILTRTNPAATGVHPSPGTSARSLAGDGAPGWWLFVATPRQISWVPPG